MQALEDIKRQLKESEKKSDALAEQVSALHVEQHTLKLKIAELKYGVTVGCIVTGKDDKQFRVTKVDARWADRPWLEGNPKKQDGSWGTAIRNLYDNWQLATQ